ncbi:MAG: hypothetical protein RSB04_04355 [Gordonibacter sp.]|uniref:hypothetical protein n=1 Tax=Gordonibacter sp. TaxID=1968902 RepID=UPI002FC84F38
MSDEMVRNFIGLLKDPAFAALCKQANESPLSWSAFKKMPMPPGLSAEQAWRVLNAIRRQTAVLLPFFGTSGRQGWYSATRSIQASLDDISRRCHEGSWLDLATKSRNTVYFLIEAHVNDAVTGLREDGLNLGYEKAREVLRGERGPEASEEVLLLNGHRAVWELERYRDAPCTPELIWDIYRQVAKGAGEQTSLSSRQASVLWGSNRFDSTASLLLIARLVNGEGVDSAEHPLLLAMAVRFLFMSTFPLPAWNGVVSSLIMKLLFLKSRLPVLAFVPILEACREWEQGIIRPPAVAASVKGSSILIDDEIDYTVYVTVMTQLARLKLDEVEGELKRVIKRDQVFSQTLRDDLDINHRQRTVLQMSLSNPAAVFRIESHRKTHRVVYATARADLLGLVGMGFLECRRVKRAFEFTVVPGIRQMLVGPAGLRP